MDQIMTDTVTQLRWDVTPCGYRRFEGTCLLGSISPACRQVLQGDGLLLLK